MATDELKWMYRDLLREKHPFLRVDDLLHFTRRCVQENLSAADMLELHQSVVDSSRDVERDFPLSDTILGVALSFRSLLLQLECTDSEVDRLGVVNTRLLTRNLNKSNILAMVAHDLSNYLTTTRVLIRTLVRDSREGFVQERCRHILKVLDEEDHLIANLLTLGKIEAGASPTTTHEVDVRTVVARCIESARGLSDHTFEVTGPSLRVLGDEDKMRQVLENLVGNAIKFSPTGQVIGIRLGVDQDRGIISVQDHGMGISEADLPHVFEPYYRTAGSQTGGTGLGLTIVKSLVELMQGDIHIESGPDGTTASFSLPLVGWSS